MSRSAHAYLDTRVSLFTRQLWPAGALNKLLDQPAEMVRDALGAHGLGFLAPGYGTADTLSLEAQITIKLLDEARILLRALHGAERQFLLYWIERFEVSNIKTLIRAKLVQEKATAITPRLVNLGPFARLDLASLVHAEDVDELLRRLEAGPYALIARNARLAFEQSRDPFMLDATLDRTYYESLAQQARALEKEVGKPLQDLMAGLIDRINLVWLLRFRFNYNLPPAQVYYLLPGRGYRLTDAVLQELVALPSLDAVLQALPPALKKSAGAARDIPEVFMRLEQAARLTARKILGSQAHVLARCFAYLILRERDLRRARAVSRGYYLGLSTDSMQAALGPAEPDPSRP
ncbi:MAG TPA: V-type ATPase subunit [Thiobacillaceae bacterium]|nr:V-type ATPase subunit [Thiobacillaceae bacterium]